MIAIELTRRIRWADADAANQLHFPRIFEYFEEGETELLRSLGITYSAESGLKFPRRHVEANFLKILPLDALFYLRVSVGKVGRTSIRYDYHIYADPAHLELAIEGRMTVVAVRDGKSAEIPQRLRDALCGAQGFVVDNSEY